MKRSKTELFKTIVFVFLEEKYKWSKTVMRCLNIISQHFTMTPYT